ncbi:PaaX family transcriptional regulator C-terminal domain-containing protein [Sinomonas sp. JGH33]|uniref:PaaX family transcriptional regulator C-terminal domain-containing protein n=1 Tax=Sinomonas terricola TaxID=3110330 RepID=A0ABU5T4W3_9MICC|nr:PaaX family transcriptional regulator C-terminal domain-containing protein [Sinomonas sp. JGH33]MEA5454191.1 PaaX family transcriptional regulator C-terminal domain-containing protein [Sinomonas sp. JGH33]
MSIAAEREPKAPTASPRNQQLLVTLFGLYGREHQGALPVAGLVRLLGDLGIESAGVRSAVSRLKKRGVLESVRVGGAAAYRLGSGLEEIFHEGDERIFSPRRASIGDPWLLAAFSVPESQRNLRHQIRSALTRLGFGAVTPGLWIAPAFLETEARTQVGRAGAAGYVEFFRADYADDGSGPTMRELVASWWDLEALESMYVEFVENHREVGERWASAEPASPQEHADAFADYVSMLTQWRRLPYLDPGLPVEYLPEDWHGVVAQDLFRTLHERLAGPARQHAERALAISSGD